MPVLAKLFIDRDLLRRLDKEELIDEVVRARQLAYDRGEQINQLREANPNDWYGSGQPYPCIPVDGGGS